MSLLPGIDPITGEILKVFGEAAGKGALSVAKKSIFALVWTHTAGRFIKPTTRVAITGMPGVGKTVLAERIHNDAVPHYQPPGTSRRVEKYKRTTPKRKIQLVTLPGQSSPERHAGNREVFHSKAVDGIVHVVSFGYAAVRSIGASEILDGTAIPLSDYRERVMVEEVEDLRRTLELIRAAYAKDRKPKWVVIAIAKVDLYWNEMLSAHRRYSPSGMGPFAMALNDFIESVGRDNIHVEVAPLCSVLESFEWNGEKLEPAINESGRNTVLSRFCSIFDDRCV